MPGLVLHQTAAEFERINARRLRQFVHETFDVNRVLIEVHPAPETGGTCGLRIAWSIRRLGML